MIKIFLIATLFYATLVLMLSLFQRQLLYNPVSLEEQPTPTQWNLASMDVVHYTTEDHLSLSAWYQAAAQSKPTVIYFHGNAGHLGERHDRVNALLNAGFGVLLTSYRGYSGNPGRPSEQGLYQDARAALNYLSKVEDIPPSCWVLYGESLGSGVAVQMATEHSVGALVLTSPYTSIMDAAQARYPWAPVRFILRDRYNSLSKITHIQAPLYIAHGAQDHLVPTQLGQRLFEQANSPKKIKLFAGVNHNDFPPELNDTVVEFLNTLPRCRPSKRTEEH